MYKVRILCQTRHNRGLAPKNLRNSCLMGSQKRGRPALDPSERRRNMGLQLSPAERDRLEQAANLAGVGLSVFVRDAALKEADRLLQSSPQGGTTNG